MTLLPAPERISSSSSKGTWEALGSTYSSSCGSHSFWFQSKSFPWERLVRERWVGWTIAPFVVAGLGATTDPHWSLLYCAFYTPLTSTSASLRDPAGEWPRSSLLRGLIPWLLVPFVGQDCCSCLITIKTGQDITKRYPGTSLKCQIYSSLPTLCNSNPTFSW